MTKIERLKVIATNEHFTTCKCCGFVYMPMASWTVNNCPKCKPMDHQIKYVDPDVEYLNTEVRLDEEISQEHLFDGNVTYKQLGL